MNTTFRNLLGVMTAAALLEAAGCSSTQKPQSPTAISRASRPETYVELKARKEKQLKEKARKINVSFASKEKQKRVEFIKTRACLNQRALEQTTGQQISLECKQRLSTIYQKLADKTPRVNVQNPPTLPNNIKLAQQSAEKQPLPGQLVTDIKLIPTIVAPTSLPQPIASTKPAPLPLPSSNFNFPQASCGDTKDSDSWYPVFIDGGNLADIRSKYCEDAISTIREKTQKPTVQLASFSDYQRALEFAKAVGGEVGKSRRD